MYCRVDMSAYVEPAIGWTIEEDVAGVIKYGVADYEPRKSVAKIISPLRPAQGALPSLPQRSPLLRPGSAGGWLQMWDESAPRCGSDSGE